MCDLALAFVEPTLPGGIFDVGFHLGQEKRTLSS